MLGQPLRWLFFYIARGIAFGLTLRRDALFILIEPPFELFHAQFDILKCFSFHAMRQREFGGKQDVFFRHFAALFQRRVSARAFQNDEVGAVSIHFEPRGQFRDRIQIGLRVGD